MTVSYNTLWELLIDKKMKKKLGKGRSVTTDILLKICDALDCDFADIMEVDQSEEGAK